MNSLDFVRKISFKRKKDGKVNYSVVLPMELAEYLLEQGFSFVRFSFANGEIKIKGERFVPLNNWTEEDEENE